MPRQTARPPRLPIIPLLLLVLALAPACAEVAPTSSRDPRVGSESAATTAAAEPGPATPGAPSSTAAAQAPASPTGAAVNAEPGATDPKRDAAPPAAPSGPRIHAKARFVWIQPAPRQSGAWIGYLTLGGSVALRGGSVEKARVQGSDLGCEWYAVEPRGYVCVGRDATLDPDDPAVVEIRRGAGDMTSPWPFSYGESTGVPRYAGVPSAQEQRRAEWDLTEHLDAVRRAREVSSPEQIAAIDKDLVGVDLSPAGVEAPTLLPFGPSVREGRKRIANGSTVAYTRSFDADGRTWLVSWDHAILPKDRVRPYPRSEFRGVDLGAPGKDSVSLPIAFFRRTPRPKYRRGEGGFEPTGDSWPALAWAALTGEEVSHAGQRFLETREPGVFASASDATVIRANEKIPFIKLKSDTEDRRKWIDISILGGWFVAYEGKTPVFATLIAPGRGGLPHRNVDPIETAATPIGTFRVDGKFATATMVSSTNSELVHTEVQFVQNFHGAHALHGAYWHGAWGELKSGGCVNLAPHDALKMFHWSDPQLPEGWHGMKSIKDFGTATTVVVRR